MICERVDLGNGTSAIVCSGRRRDRRKKCACGAEATLLCDYVIAPAFGHASAVTCDKPLCGRCAFTMGKNRHHCSDHPPLPGQSQLNLGL